MNSASYLLVGASGKDAFEVFGASDVSEDSLRLCFLGASNISTSESNSKRDDIFLKRQTLVFN